MLSFLQYYLKIIDLFFFFNKNLLDVITYHFYFILVGLFIPILFSSFNFFFLCGS